MTPAQLKIRMSDDLRKKVERAAKASGNSLNNELVNRLESTFDARLRLVRGEHEAPVIIHKGKLLLLAGMNSPVEPIELNLAEQDLLDLLEFFGIEEK